MIVDDNDDDIFLLTRALRRSGVTHEIEVAVSSALAMKYFQALLADSPEPIEFPSLVILDLKMPVVDGFELLKWISSHPGLRKLQIYVLSSSVVESDPAVAIHLGASGFWAKPSSSREYQEIADKIKNLLLPLADSSSAPEGMTVSKPGAGSTKGA